MNTGCMARMHGQAARLESTKLKSGLKAAFDKWDADGNKQITIEELEALGIEGPQLQKLLAGIDINKDKSISYHELTSAVRKLLDHFSIGPEFPAGSAAVPSRYDGDLIPRVDVITFFYDNVHVNEKVLDQPTARLQRDLFILGLARMQQAPYVSDPWSFYQIAGIHGLPYQPYDGDDATAWLEELKKASPQLWFGGYCHHGDVLFPTWHRPYMLLYERAVIHWAKRVVEEESGLSAEEKATALLECDKLRLPYLDWASTYVRTNGLPDVLTSAKITVHWPKLRTLNNPLKGYTVPVDLGVLVQSGAEFNPSAKPEYQPPPQGAVPYTPKGYGTVRYPDNYYRSNNDSAQVALIRGCNLALRSQVCEMFGIPDWARFSNHSETQSDSEINTGAGSYGTFCSVEMVHDSMDDYMGGAGGHMAYPDVTAFDPIFYFHHANVDRLIALWQFCYDNAATGPIASWMPILSKDSKFQEQGNFVDLPGTALSEETELRLFRKIDGGNKTWFTSKDVRNVERDMNYTYPELTLAKAKNWKPEDMLQYIVQLYKSADDTKIKWFVNLSGIRKMQFQSSYHIRVFIDKPDATSLTPLSDVHFAGSVFVFARGQLVRCVSCKDDGMVRATVDITSCLLNLHYAAYPEISGNVTAESVRSQVHVNISNKNITLVYVSADGKTQLTPDPRDEPPTQVITWQLDLGHHIIDANAAEAITRMPAAHLITSNAFSKPPAWGVRNVHWGVIGDSK